MSDGRRSKRRRLESKPTFESSISFLSLPGEIRNRIYGFYFSSLKTPWKFGLDGEMRNREFVRFDTECINLYLVNHQIYSEARSYFFENAMSTFEFQFEDQAALLNLLHHMPKQYHKGINGCIWFYNDIDEIDDHVPIDQIVNLVVEAVGFNNVDDLRFEKPEWYKESEHNLLKRLVIPRIALDKKMNDNEDETQHENEDDKETLITMEWESQDWDSGYDAPFGHVKIEGALGELKTLEDISVAC